MNVHSVKYHLGISHNLQRIEIPLNKFVKILCEVGNAERGDTWNPFLLKWSQKHKFLLHASVKFGALHFWIQHLGLKRDAEKFVYTLSIGHPNRECFTYTGMPYGIGGNVDFDSVLTLTNRAASKFLDENLNLGLDVCIKLV